MQAPSHMTKHLHIYIFAYMHTNIHLYIYTYIHTYIYTYTCAGTDPYDQKPAAAVGCAAFFGECIIHKY